MRICSLCGTYYKDPQKETHPDMECYEQLESRVQNQKVALAETRQALTRAGERLLRKG